MSHLLYTESNKHDGNLSLRLDTEENVIPRREEFLSKHNVSSKDCVFMQTEHGDKITHVSTSNKGEAIFTEALITQDRGVVLFLLTGDCLPIAFYDPIKEVIALAHLGWKPTDMRLVLKVVQELSDMYQSDPKDIKVFIGPGIHKESYVLTELLQNERETWTGFLTSLPTGETQVDLIGYNQKQLRESGVLAENIYVNPVDTAIDTEYFSHYRSVRTGEPEGRFATILGLL